MQAKAYIFKKEGHFKMARKKIIAGNWKMNKTPSEAVALVNELKPLVANEDVDVVFCPKERRTERIVTAKEI